MLGQHIGEPLFLVDSQQKINVVADQLTHFIESAKHSVDIAIYDFRLKDPKIAKQIVDALMHTAKRVNVRIAYDHRNAPKFGIGDDPAPHGTHDFLNESLAGSKVNLKPVEWSDIKTASIAGSKLMHSKYIIRDAHTDDASVWMGSTNFTDDAWTRQDNNILVINSAALSAYYETDFNELWSTGKVAGTGVNDTGTITIDGKSANIAFSPGEGRHIDGEIAALIAGAKKSLHIASMLITSDAIIKALIQQIEAGRLKELVGIFDGPEMASAEHQMRSPDKKAQVDEIKKVLVAKASNPYSDQGVHNFMHNKLVVADDVVLTGSHNFSLSATHNAENAVLVRDEALAAKYRKYVEQLVEHYRV